MPKEDVVDVNAVIDEALNPTQEEEAASETETQESEEETPPALSTEEKPADTPTQEEPPATEEEPAVDEETGEPEPEPENYLANYKTKDAAEAGHQEKDRLILEQKAKIEAYENIQAMLKQSNPEPSPSSKTDKEAWVDYTEELDEIADSKGQYAATARLITDVVKQLRSDEKAQDKAESAKYDAWKKGLKADNPNISDGTLNSLVEKYKELEQQTNLNPLSILLQAERVTEKNAGGDKEKLNAALKTEAAKALKRQIPKTTSNRLAVATEDDKLQKGVDQAVEKGSSEDAIAAVLARHESFINKKQRQSINR